MGSGLSVLHRGRSQVRSLGAGYGCWVFFVMRVCLAQSGGESVGLLGCTQ